MRCTQATVVDDDLARHVEALLSFNPALRSKCCLPLFARRVRALPPFRTFRTCHHVSKTIRPQACIKPVAVAQRFVGSRWDFARFAPKHLTNSWAAG